MTKWLKFYHSVRRQFLARVWGDGGRAGRDSGHAIHSIKVEKHKKNGRSTATGVVLLEKIETT